MSGSTLRVALLSPSFWPEVQRGSERMVGELAKGLADRGHGARVVTSHPGPSSRSLEDGVEVVRNRRASERLLAARGFQEHLVHVPLSYRALRKGNDDLAHAFFPTDAAAAIRWARRCGRPAVFSYMGIPQREVLASRRLRLRLIVQAVSEADAVLALSDAAAAGMRRWLGVEPRVIRPGVDLARFSQGEERFEQPTIVCAAASDDARKRVPMLARAFQRVRRDRPDARLLLDRPRRDPAAERDLLAIGAGIEFFDAPPSGVADLFAHAWVSALTSYNEAFGLVLVESLACGTPVVGTRDGGITEIVDSDDIGFLFDRDDEAGLADALLRALELAELTETRDRCRARAMRFSTERTTDEHEALYRELISAA